jgi:pre-mRNA cleavage complex 2 protein Pcf11
MESSPPQLPEEQIPDLTSLDVNLLKQKYNQAIQNLYGGTQCATCGMRFTSEQTKRFSNHYDWHFRQNKREKEEINKAHNRNWYYDVTEWIQYEELSEEDPMQKKLDGDTRTLPTLTNELSSYLSSNNTNNEDLNETSNNNNNNIQLNSTLKTSICAATNDIDDKCCICEDPFEIFWDGDKEEWFFKDALRVGNKVYHPVCFDDATEVCY